jgi:predicted HTH domain antitoxin
MLIELPDNVLEHLLNKQKMLLEIAIYLFEKDKLTLGKAAEFAGIPKMQMQNEIGGRGINMHYDEEMLENDLKSIEIYNKKYDSSK